MQINQKSPGNSIMSEQANEIDYLSPISWGSQNILNFGY